MGGHKLQAREAFNPQVTCSFIWLALGQLRLALISFYFLLWLTRHTIHVSHMLALIYFWLVWVAFVSLYCYANADCNDTYYASMPSCLSH